MTIYVNDVPLNSFKFPAGECHLQISKSSITDCTRITACLDNSDDIMCLLLAIDAVRRIKQSTKIKLFIPYFPYARQDRVCNVGEPLSAKVMADLINNLNVSEVVICDPHSDVTPALLNKSRIISMADIIRDSIVSNEILSKKLKLVSPDAGSEKKIRIVAKDMGCEVIMCGKNRSVKTGEIIGTEVYGYVNGCDLMILDDICDGGRTFIELAKRLKKLGAKNLYLYITHGVFSKGLSELKEYFERIYCYRTILHENDIDKERLIVLKG